MRWVQPLGNSKKYRMKKIFNTIIFLFSTCALFAQDAADVQFIYVENGKIQKEFTSFDEIESFIKELNQKDLKGDLFTASLMSLEALIVPEIPPAEGVDDPPAPNPNGNGDGILNASNNVRWEQFLFDVGNLPNGSFNSKYKEIDMVTIALDSPKAEKIPDWLKSTTGSKSDKYNWWVTNYQSLQ